MGINLSCRPVWPRSASRIAALILVCVLIFGCSGVLTFEVWKFEPISESLKGSATKAGYVPVELGDGWTTSRYRVARDQIVVWFSGGRQSWSGSKGTPRGATITIEIENDSDRALSFDATDLVLVPTQVRPRKAGQNYLDKSRPLEYMNVGPSTPSKTSWGWTKVYPSESNDPLLVKPGETVRVNAKYDLPVRLRRGYVDFKLSEDQNESVYTYRFWIKPK